MIGSHFAFDDVMMTSLVSIRDLLKVRLMIIESISDQSRVFKMEFQKLFKLTCSKST